MLQHQHSPIKISPSVIQLQGILLTSNLNIQNIHQHLAVKFVIKSFVNNKEVQCMEIFPEKGTIMRGQIKKIRLKYLKQYEYLINNNNNNNITSPTSTPLSLQILTSLNTSYNKQYMQINHLSGWSQISSSSIQQNFIPIIITQQYKQIKQNIREQVKFQSQFGKISQQMSSLYGYQKFQLVEQPKHLMSNNKSKNKYLNTHMKPHLNTHLKRYSQLQHNKHLNNTAKKLSEQKYKNNSRVVYYGMQPQKSSQIKINTSMYSQKQNYNQSRSFSYDEKNKIQQVNESPFKNKESINRNINIKRDINTNNNININMNMNRNMNRNSNSNSNINRNANLKTNNIKISPFVANNSNKQLHHNINNNNESDIFNDYSSVSILKQIQSSQQQLNQSPHQHHNKQIKQNYQQQQFNTVRSNNHDDFDHSNEQINSNVKHKNSRSIQLIILAVIAGFFVALGSNMRRIIIG